MLQTRQAGWLGFLPLNEVLAGDSADMIRSQAEIRALQARVARLHRRTALLRGPVDAAQTRLHALNRDTRGRAVTLP